MAFVEVVVIGGFIAVAAIAMAGVYYAAKATLGKGDVERRR